MQKGDRVFLNGTEEIEIGGMEGDVILWATGIDNPDSHWCRPDMRWITAARRPNFPYNVETSRIVITHVMVPLPSVIEAPPAPVLEHETPQGKRVRAKLSDPLPSAVQQAFLDHLKKWNCIRLVYRTEVDTGVKKWFADNKAAHPDSAGLPIDIIPSKSKMHSVAGTVTFLKPADESILPAGLKYIPRNTQKESRLEVNDVRLVVALNNAGFAITNYTKEDNAKIS